MPLSQLLFSLEGRIPRSTFWITMILMSLVNYAVTFGLLALADEEALGSLMLIPLLAWIAVLVVVSIAVQGKRWHDREKSAWWILIGCVPIIGGIWAFIECGVLRGTDGPNDYGPDPL